MLALNLPPKIQLQCGADGTRLRRPRRCPPRPPRGSVDRAVAAAFCAVIANAAFAAVTDRADAVAARVVEPTADRALGEVIGTAARVDARLPEPMGRDASASSQPPTPRTPTESSIPLWFELVVVFGLLCPTLALGAKPDRPHGATLEVVPTQLDQCADPCEMRAKPIQSWCAWA